MDEVPNKSSPTDPSQAPADTQDDTTQVKLEADPSLADWFKVKREGEAADDDAEESVTEDDTDPDSENDDVKEEEADDDWLNVGEDGEVEDSQMLDGEVSL